MSKIYNTQEEIATNFKYFIKKCIPDIRKTQLKIIPFILFGMINSESTVASDIAKNLKDDFSLIQHESVIRRIKRLFVNKHFYPYDFYDKIIRYIISNYKKKHPDKRVHITFDHMFSHDNYIVFMITMRIGKQGIPLWFRCFDNNNSTSAFKESLLKSGISYVSSLFDSSFDLIFLADRWFNSTILMKHIDSLGHTYCIRLKQNMKVFIYDKREKHKVWKWIGDLFVHECTPTYYKDIMLSEKKYKANIVFSKKQGYTEPWIIVTNGDCTRALKDYSYRFGSIESVFKNQKSNGFYLESTVKASIKYFESLYTLACLATLYLTIVGADYTKNSKCYRNVKITTHKKFNGIKKRVMSLFNTGLTLFHLAFNSLKYIRLPFKFILYDV